LVYGEGKRRRSSVVLRLPGAVGGEGGAAFAATVGAGLAEQPSHFIKVGASICARSPDGANIVTCIPGVVANSVHSWSAVGEVGDGLVLIVISTQVVCASRFALICGILRLVERLQTSSVGVHLVLLVCLDSLSGWDTDGPRRLILRAQCSV
jgi:hypothetical protein